MSDLLCEEARSILETTDLKSCCILFKGWWNKSDCAKQPDAVFVFGDNDIRKGCKGQAVIRYCSNAIGIPTKKFPSFANTAYYTDNEYEQNKEKIIDSIEDLIIKFEGGEYDTIYFPEDGLGTGLSKLDQKAPETLKFLNKILAEVFGINY